MNIPKKIKVGGHLITVKKVSGEDLADFGEYDNYYKLIRLRNDKGIPESAASEVFMHEIFECIIRQNNLSMDHTHLTVLSEGLFQVIRDNKLDFT